MKEMDDYSGEFKPDLKLTDFSKGGLIKLVEIGGAIYGGVNRNWYAAVAKRYGEQVADEMHHEVWFADGGCGDLENETISGLMGFSHLDDETAPMRIFQCLPAMATRMNLVFEQQGDHEWILSAPQCVVPETGEKEGPEVMKFMCEKICYHLEVFGFRWGAAGWNPNIRIDPIKLPPRADKSEPHCAWRITLEDKPVDYVEQPGDLVLKMGLQRETDTDITDPKFVGKFPKK
jgi:hypothetical protein